MSDLKFFFDHCISRKLARAFKELGLDVMALVDHWPEADSVTVKDTVWMPVVAAMGRIAVSVDKKISRNPEERRVRREARLTTFYLHKDYANAVGWDQVVMLVRWWPAIVSAAERCKQGDCFTTTINGKVMPYDRD